MPVTVTPLPWDGTPRDSGEIWRLTLRDRVAVCRLWTHPLGAEIPLDVDDEMSRTEAGRDGLALLDLALEWETQFTGKGWTR